MLFSISYATSSGTAIAGRDRFKQTGGGPPAGVRMIARYHHADGSGGVAIAETDDPIALAKWAAEWTDVIRLDCRPVLTDEQMAQVF